MRLDLEGKVALVTGGTVGIGKATAVAFAEAGAKVVITGRRAEKAPEALEAIAKAGGEGAYIQADVSKAGDVAALFKGAIARFGRLDCAVNNAAIEAQKKFLDWDESEWDEMVGINLKGVWLCMKSEISHMLERGGAIVNVSSVAGLLGFPLHAPYVAAKHGVLGLTRSAATEFAAQRIRVNTICPGAIATPMLEKGFAEDPANAALAVSMNPMGRVGQPEELAHAAVWLCSDFASYVTGATLSVDGGWSQH